jgi:hypothetical protein
LTAKQSIILPYEQQILGKRVLFTRGTPEGKAQGSRNAYKGGTRPQFRELARILRELAKEEKKLREAIIP